MKPDKEKLYIGFYKNTSPDYKKTVEAILSLKNAEKAANPPQFLAEDKELL